MSADNDRSPFRIDADPPTTKEQEQMSIKIQKPTVGRVVEYTAESGVAQASVVLVAWSGGAVDLRNQSTLSKHERVAHNSDGTVGTWRYPPFVKEEIEVER